MTTRQKDRERPDGRDDHPSDPGAPNEALREKLGALQSHGDRLLAAAGEAIGRAMSDDSQSFNKSSRQDGGE